MTLYRKFIRPMHCYPGQSYEPKMEPVEKEEKWYPEEEYERLKQVYGYLNKGCFSDLVFDVKFEPYVEEQKEDTETDKKECEEIWMERNKGYWFITEPAYLTCSECGFNYYTGYESAKETQEHYNKSFGLYFCPHCGSEMTREDGSDICLCVN